MILLLPYFFSVFLFNFCKIILVPLSWQQLKNRKWIVQFCYIGNVLRASTSECIVGWEKTFAALLRQNLRSVFSHWTFSAFCAYYQHILMTLKMGEMLFSEYTPLMRNLVKKKSVSLCEYCVTLDCSTFNILHAAKSLWFCKLELQCCSKVWLSYTNNMIKRRE